MSRIDRNYCIISD